MNLEIHLVKENIVLSEGSRSHEKFIHGIKVLMAKNYIDNLSEETKKGMLEKAAQGIWPGAAPLGYVNVTGPHGKRIIDVDPVAGPLVSKMFELYANGEMSVKALATWAKANGLPFKRSHAEVPVSSVHRMLCNLLYTGEYSWDGTLYQGTHKPLVTRELWERVQDKMEGRNPYSRHDTKLSFAFSGLVRCGTCIDAGGSENRLLIGEIQKQKYIYYHCAGCAHQKRAAYIKEEVLDAQMQQVLRSLHVDDEVMQMVRDGLRGSHEDEQRCHQEATQRLYKQHETLQRRIDMAYDDRLDGRITAEMFERKATEWRAEQARVRRELERHENANQTYIDQGMALLEVANRAAEMYVGRTPDQKRRMLNFVLLNSTWRDGKLEVEWREPFNLLAKSIAECKSENASSVVTGGVRSQWLRGRDLNERDLLLSTWPDVGEWVIAQGCQVTTPFSNLGNADHLTLPDGDGLHVLLLHGPHDGWWVRVVAEGVAGNNRVLAQLALGDVRENMPARWVIDPVKGGALGVSLGAPFAGSAVPRWLERTAVEVMPAPAGTAVAVTLRVAVIHGNGMSAIDGQTLAIVP